MTKLSTQFSQVDSEMRQAIAAKKCWRCGYFQDTVTALQDSSAIHQKLADLLEESRSLFEPKRYDCLGCDICWPAVAQNLAAEIDPAVAEGGTAPQWNLNSVKAGRRCPVTIRWCVCRPLSLFVH
jgi:hypothetical protein